MNAKVSWGDDESVNGWSDSGSGGDNESSTDDLVRTISMKVRHKSETSGQQVVFKRQHNALHPSLVWAEYRAGKLWHMYSRNETVESLADWMRCDFENVEVQSVEYDDEALKV